MGVPLDAAETIDKSIEHPIAKGPLSWGISNMALAQDKMNNKILLKYVKFSHTTREYFELFLFQEHQEVTVSQIYRYGERYEGSRK